MAEISPVTIAPGYKAGVNSWEETIDSQSSDDGCKFVEVRIPEQSFQEVDVCPTYTVTSEDAIDVPCKTESPTERFHSRNRPVCVGYTLEEFDQNATRVISPPTYSIGPQRVNDMDVNADRSSVVPVRGHVYDSDGCEPVAPPPSYTSQTQQRTQLANCCTKLSDPLHCNAITPSVVRIPEDTQRTSKIHVQLENAELWKQFYSVDTEMIITKAGRRMFPGITVSVCGLEPDSKYTLQMEMCPASSDRYKYVNSEWLSVGKGDSHDPSQMVHVHPDSPANGKQWMRDKVHFKKVKLTNDKNTRKAYVVLNSMHKYQPRIHILRHLNKKETTLVYSIDFPQTQFVAVTAYQNDLVTQLKIDNNPFAKAFRETDEQQFEYKGTMVTGGWSMPSTPLPSPAESTYSNGASSMSSTSPLPQFNVAFGNWDVNARPVISPFVNKPDKPMPQWPYPLAMPPAVRFPMMVPPYPGSLLPTSATESGTYPSLPPSSIPPPPMPTYTLPPLPGYTLPPTREGTFAEVPISPVMD